MSNGIIIVLIFNWSNNINGPPTAEQISNTNLHKSHKGMRKLKKKPTPEEISNSNLSRGLFIILSYSRAFVSVLSYLRCSFSLV